MYTYSKINALRRLRFIIFLVCQRGIYIWMKKSLLACFLQAKTSLTCKIQTSYKKSSKQGWNWEFLAEMTSVNCWEQAKTKKVVFARCLLCFNWFWSYRTVRYKPLMSKVANKAEAENFLLRWLQPIVENKLRPKYSCLLLFIGVCSIRAVVY